jgi:quercetin dioxygenase-like cupin family protein
MITNPRRIVTALAEDGTSYLARIEELHDDMAERTAAELEELRVGYPRFEEGERPGTYTVWGAEELPFVLPSDPAVTPSGKHVAPGQEGFRLGLLRYPPGWQGELFWSNRVDFLIILEGEFTYRTETDEVVLRAGDVVVQNGTNKAFANDGDGPVWAVGLCFGAMRVGATPPHEQFHGTQETLRRHLEIGRDYAARST